MAWGAKGLSWVNTGVAIERARASPARCFMAGCYTRLRIPRSCRSARAAIPAYLAEHSHERSNKNDGHSPCDRAWPLVFRRAVVIDLRIVELASDPQLIAG